MANTDPRFSDVYLDRSIAASGYFLGYDTETQKQEARASLEGNILQVSALDLKDKVLVINESKNFAYTTEQLDQLLAVVKEKGGLGVISVPYGTTITTMDKVLIDRLREFIATLDEE